MSDETGDNPNPGQITRKNQVVLISRALLVVFCLVTTAATGSILVNVAWPASFGAWLKVLLGGVLILISTLGMTYMADAAKGLIKDKGGAKKGHENSYRWLRLVPSWGKVAATVILSGALITTAMVVPNITVPPPPPFEPGPIRVISAFDESENDPRWMLMQQWDTAHPRNKIEMIPVGGETDDQHESMVEAARTNAADVLLLDMVWMPEFIEQDWIRPLDEATLTEDVNDFLPNVLDTCKGDVGGREGLWALPFNTDAGVVYHRSDLGAPAPTTWGEYFGEAARDTFRRTRDQPAVLATEPNLAAANSASFAREEILVVLALEAMWAAGGVVVNEYGVPVASPDGNEVVFDTNALAGLRDLSAAFKDAETVLPSSAEADELVAATAFGEGRALYMRNWPVAHDALMAGDREKQFDVAPLPHRSVLGGQNLAIARHTDKPRIAQELIEFLTSPSSQLTLFEIGGFAPTRQSAYINSRRPYKDILRSTVEQARPRVIMTHYTEFSDEFSKGIDRALKAGGQLEPDFPRRLMDIWKKG